MRFLLLYGHGIIIGTRKGIITCIYSIWPKCTQGEVNQEQLWNPITRSWRIRCRWNCIVNRFRIHSNRRFSLSALYTYFFWVGKVDTRYLSIITQNVRWDKNTNRNAIMYIVDCTFETACYTLLSLFVKCDLLKSQLYFVIWFCQCFISLTIRIIPIIIYVCMFTFRVFIFIYLIVIALLYC